MRPICALLAVFALCGTLADNGDKGKLRDRIERLEKELVGLEDRVEVLEQHLPPWKAE